MVMDLDLDIFLVALYVIVDDMYLTFPYADFDLPPYGFSTHTL
jgi:hypothetical protein